MEDELERILNDSIGDNITLNKAMDILYALFNRQVISQKELKIMQSVLSERALNNVNYDDRNKLRADLLKEMILTSADDLN